ncbi:hypothetical protein V5O48_011777 [Marasmius crinis-equi]|uniref:DUF7888 domain-containing protein n=1 Tax=Marasmius crinis-equi TaxID=585013 RepID=A0ABR3F4P5_9AGAR
MKPVSEVLDECARPHIRKLLRLVCEKPHTTFRQSVPSIKLKFPQTAREQTVIIPTSVHQSLASPKSILLLLSRPPVATTCDLFSQLSNASVTTVLPADLAKRASAKPTRAGGGIAGTIIAQILPELLETLVPIKKWGSAREHFTQKTTSLMFDNNPNPAGYPAVACYSKGWRVKDPAGISDVQNVKLRLGIILHTDYDCMYIGHNNQFYKEGDGGYINLCYTYDPTYCSFDISTGSLTCD